MHPFLREEVVLEDLAIDIDAPNIASAGADMRQKTRDIIEHEGAVVISEDLLTGVDSPNFIGMAVVRVAIADRDLSKLARHLHELLGGKVVLKDLAPCVKSPDRVRLQQAAAAHGNLCELSRHLGEFRRWWH